MNEKKIALEIGDLSDVGVVLSDEELSAVSGARPNPSWTSGTPARTDEWVYG